MRRAETENAADCALNCGHVMTPQLHGMGTAGTETLLGAHDKEREDAADCALLTPDGRVVHALRRREPDLPDTHGR